MQLRHLRLWKLRASELWQSLLLEVRHAKVWHELLPDPCCHPRRLWSEACLWRKPTRHRTACGSTPREDQHDGGGRAHRCGDCYSQLAIIVMALNLSEAEAPRPKKPPKTIPKNERNLDVHSEPTFV